MNRDYNESLVDAAIDEARKIPKLEAIKYKPHNPPTGDKYLWSLMTPDCHP